MNFPSAFLVGGLGRVHLQALELFNGFMDWQSGAPWLQSDGWLNLSVV